MIWRLLIEKAICEILFILNQSFFFNAVNTDLDSDNRTNQT